MLTFFVFSVRRQRVEKIPSVQSFVATSSRPNIWGAVMALGFIRISRCGAPHSVIAFIRMLMKGKSLYSQWSVLWQSWSLLLDTFAFSSTTRPQSHHTVTYTLCFVELNQFQHPWRMVNELCLFRLEATSIHPKSILINRRGLLEFWSPLRFLDNLSFPVECQETNHRSETWIAVRLHRSRRINEANHFALLRIRRGELTSLDRFMSRRIRIIVFSSESVGFSRLNAPSVRRTERMFLRPKS